MKRIALLFMALALCALASGCAVILEREFYDEEPHVARPVDFSLPEGDEINNYYKLKNTLLSLIAEGAETDKLRLTAYSGDLDEDLRRITAELTENTPLGAYALSSIVFEHTKMMTYHDVQVSIQYRRTAEQIKSLAAVVNAPDFDRRVKNAYAEGRTFLLLETSSYAASVYNADRLLRLYYETPGTAYGLSSVSIATFPETGYRRVMEVTFTWLESPEELAEKAAQADEAAKLLGGKLAGGDAFQTVKNIFDYLTSEVAPDKKAGEAAVRARGFQPKTDPYTAYGALCQKKAAPEGMALAFAKLCADNAIEGLVVTGTADGAFAFWNLARINGEWYHMDCAAAAGADDPYEYFLLTENAAAGMNYRPDSSYPVAAEEPYGPPAETVPAKGG